MSFQLVFTKRAQKQLKSLALRQQRMILVWLIENLDGCENPKAVFGAKQIVGTSYGWRYRVGSYRILARILEKELLIEVVRIGHRQGVYDNLPDI